MNPLRFADAHKGALAAAGVLIVGVAFYARRHPPAGTSSSATSSSTSTTPPILVPGTIQAAPAPSALDIYGDLEPTLTQIRSGVAQLQARPGVTTRPVTDYPVGIAPKIINGHTVFF